MTEWTSVSDAETSWKDSDTLSSGSEPYDNIFAYDSDFINYDGYIVLANIDYTAQADAETSWLTIT